jgi:4-hydroxy-tetrahydrodipicolinate synthase
LRRLALDCPNIVGIKDTVDCISHIRRLIGEVKAARPDFAVFCGFDEYMIDTLLLGGDGVIPATSNFAPEITCGLYDGFRRKDFARIAGLLPKLALLQGIYTLHTPFVGLIKEAIRLTGSPVSTAVIAPASAPDEAAKGELAGILIRAGLL